ncbi:Zn(2)-C6 fungal-type domain-containing protein [Mycena indigotica]|uniref:Zn(2)-C6 fungal-type domain-containing protein n=1 Tax=Mycena indigotica TaxID=2126181 RepID=A0A8H6WFV0_9AGAR|nr:Zn(2)-C6 fungal-type domain-containing protein [Mycena indigotica]KAF7316142.1 Zn(2)-C6 fungal-type domain-containing protein [Mycena indigotica]
MDEPANSPSTSAAGPRKSQVTSCAECRRLKLRCDRVFPCSSCIRRGCANLCPSGTLEKGKRGFLKRLEQSLPSAKPGADQEHSEVAMFVARDAAMQKRIQELEQALTGAGVPIPGTAPPTSEPSRAKRPRTLSNTDQSTDVTLGFGTLTIDSDKRSRYVGPSGGAAYLTDLWKGNHSRGSSDENSTDRSVSPQQMAILTKMGCLPRYDDAIRIAHIYFANAAFMYEIIPEKIFFNTHLPAIYPDRAGPYAPTNLHILALVSMVLAVGTYFDLNHPPETLTPVAARYFELAVAALNVTIPLKLDTIPAVQTLHLMALYFLSTQGEAGGEPAWQLLGMAMRSIQAQGCHRDGSRWGLPGPELEERRRVFWETHMYDRIQSFTFGRPYSQSDAHHDCEMPTTCDTPLPSDDDPVNSAFSHTRWHVYKFRFARLLGRIADRVFGAAGPTYSVILELDGEINKSYAALPGWMLSDAVVHPIATLPTHALGAEGDLRRDAQIASLTNMYFLTLLHLHRGPFCRALMEGAGGLATSRYRESVDSLVRAARAIIDNARGAVCAPSRLVVSSLSSRMWYFTFHTFTASVCLAVLVLVAPAHPLAAAAYDGLQAAIELFGRADGERARVAAERARGLAARAGREMQRAAEGRTGVGPDLHTGREPDSEAGHPPGRPPAVPLAGRMAFPTSNLRGEPGGLVGHDDKTDSRAAGGGRPGLTTTTTIGAASSSAPDDTSHASLAWGRADAGANPGGHVGVPGPSGYRHQQHPHPQQPYAPPMFAPAAYLAQPETGMFDVGAFIQSGAQAWMAYDQTGGGGEGGWHMHHGGGRS